MFKFWFFDTFSKSVFNASFSVSSLYLLNKALKLSVELITCAAMASKDSEPFLAFRWITRHNYTISLTIRMVIVASFY